MSVRAEQFHVLFWVFCGLNLTIKPCNKSFIDQACSVKMAGYWSRSFVAFLRTETKSTSMKTQKKEKKERGQYPAIFTEQAWSIRILILTILVLGLQFLFITCGLQTRASSLLFFDMLILFGQRSFPLHAFPARDRPVGPQTVVTCHVLTFEN